MKKKALLLPLLGGAMILSACGPVSGSTSESVSLSDSGGAGQTTSDSSSTPLPVVPNTTIDAELLAKLAAASLDGKGAINEDGIVTDTTLFIGKKSYSFHDVDPMGTVYANAYYIADEDGLANYYERTTENNVLTGVVQDSLGDVPFEEYFYNPFADITVEDLTEDGGVYTLAADKALAFATPIYYYTLDEVSELTLTRSGDVLTVAIKGSYDYYGEAVNVMVDMDLTVSEAEDLSPLTPFGTEDYHAGIAAGLDAWNEALSGPSDTTGFVYEKTMTPLVDNGMGVAHSRSTITYNATLFDNDGGITSTNDHGFALFDDGQYYSFEIVDDEVVQGELLSAYDCPIPWPSMVAAEMFVPTDEEGVYAYRDPDTALSAVGCFLEDPEVGSLLSYVGAATDLTITLGEDNIITNFSYTAPMFDLSFELYEERVSVDIVDFDTATIDYEFKAVPFEIPASWYGTYAGTDYYSGDKFTLVIGEAGLTLNGNAATLSGVTTDSYGNYYGTLICGSDSYSFTFYPEDGSYEAMVILENDYMSAYLYPEADGPATVTMPESMVGTWIGGDYTIVASEDGTITVNGEAATLGEWEETSTGAVQVEITFGEMTLLLIYRESEDSLFLGDDAGTIAIDLVREGQPSEPAIDPKYVGTWVGIDDDTGASHTLIINADGTATYDGAAFDEPLEFVASMLFVKATGTIAGVEYTITYWDVANAPYMTVEDDNYTVAKLYLQEPTGPVLDIPDAFLGTWVSEDGAHTLVLSNDGTSTFDGELITSFATGEFSGEYVMEAAGVTYYLSAIGTGEGAMIYLSLPDGYLMLYKA